MTEQLRQQVLGILTEEQVPILDSDQDRIVIPAPGEDSSTVLILNFVEIYGLPSVWVSSPILLEVDAGGRNHLRILELLNEINRQYLFGHAILYTPEGENAFIALEQGLLGLDLRGESFARMLAAIASTADDMDDYLMKELGQGKRFQDLNQAQQVAEA